MASEDNNKIDLRASKTMVLKPSTPESAELMPGSTSWFGRLKQWIGGGRPAASTISTKAYGGVPGSSGEWRYGTASEVGRGGMGIIYKVYDTQMDRTSAMKVALPFILRNPIHSSRFLAEGKITGQLEHPNIVPVHDLGRTPEQGLFYTMKLVDGKPLTQILDQIRHGEAAVCAQYDRHALLTIFRKACDAVAFAHANSIIHRDIKPENMMVGAYGEVLLMDWGLAKKLATLDPDEEMALAASAAMGRSAGASTAPGVVKGTPCYMAPEQAKGLTSEVDCQTDVYLLGATLYHIVTLSPPYMGSSADEVIDKAAIGVFLPPQERAPELQIPDELARIICRAMAADKRERYATVQELATDLDALMSGRCLPERRSFAPGGHLMYAGEHGLEGYVILSGEVEVYRESHGDKMTLVKLGPGHVVGEMAIITDEKRSASVVALKPTDVQVITSASMKAELKKLAPWMGKVVDSLARRLQKANANVHPLLLGPCERHVARQLYYVALCQGVRVTDPAAGGGTILRDLAVAEISYNLALPVTRVNEALQQLERLGLVAVTADDGVLHISNYRALESFFRSE